MTGTFSSFSTALSALRYTRVAMDVASSTMTDVFTEGDTRRRVESASVGGPTQPTMWSIDDGHGVGVAVTGVSRLSDLLLDNRVRTEHGTQHYLDVRQTALEQLEQGVGEPGDTGLAAALSGFRSAWHHLANTPGNGAARGQVLSVAGTVAAALHDQSTHLTDTTAAERQKLVSVVDEVNGVAASLADCNRAITVGTLGGADVSILLDTRHQLSLRLTELTGSMTTIRPDGGADVSVLGVPLVSGHEASVLRVASGVAADGSADGARVTFDLTAPGGATTTLATAPGGETGALDTLLDVTLPAYRQGLDAVASALADSVNALHRGGFDAAGNPGAAVFSYEASDPATSFAVALTDPALVAASSVPGGGLDAGNADRLATAGGVEGQYQRLVSGLGTTVQSARWAATNQQVLTTQFASAREQLAGVSLDEETVSKMQNQRAFEAASKVLSTLDSVLDTLINRMLA